MNGESGWGEYALSGKADRATAKKGRALEEELGSAIEGEVRFDKTSRALYAADGSNYRRLPIGVVIPRTREDVIRAVALCRKYEAPIFNRGAGTALAGQTCNTAVCLDFSKYLNRIIDIDPEARTAKVEPGVILDQLRTAAASYGLTFGPDPATHTHCTLSGMMGNNSCGIPSVMAGGTADNVHELAILTWMKRRFFIGNTWRAINPNRSGEMPDQANGHENGAGLIRKTERVEKRKSEYARYLVAAGISLAVLLFSQVAGATIATEHMLNPAGPAAARIEGIWWEMLLVYGAVYLITLAALVWALALRKRERRLPGTRFVFITGIAIPTVILVVMLIAAIRDTVGLGGKEPGFRVKVISHHWWFEVRYPELGIVDANEINIPAGVVTDFELQSSAVVHSFWVPRLGGKRDMLPDHPTYLQLTADRPGIFRGTCTEYCAGPHALMAFRLIAHEQASFDEWVRQRRGPPAEPTEPRLVRGRQVFSREGCMACHAIRGLSRARAGPDLTLVGTRGTLGAGTIANSEGGLAGWIANPQAIKPGNMMPRSFMSPEDLHALTAFLRSLP